MPLEKFIKTAKEFRLISPGDRILVAFSGGPDSVFLLTMLKKSQRIFKIDIAVAHFHHGLRGVEADRDLEFSRDFAGNLPFFEGHGDVRSYAKEKKLTLEEAARELRYKFLYETLEKWGGTKIATAHTLSDTVETILFNFFRGTGPTGIAGIPIKRDRLIRPIITFSRDEIIEYLDKNRIPYVIDSTNLSLEYTRNYIRHVIVPAIKRKFPAFEKNIFNASRIFAEERPYFEGKSRSIENDSVKLILHLKNSNYIQVLDTKALKRYHKLELYWFFRLFLELDFLHVVSAENVIHKPQGRLELPENLKLIKSYDELAIVKGELPTIETTRVKPPFKLRYESLNVEIYGEPVKEAVGSDNPWIFYWHNGETFEIGPRRPGEQVFIRGVGRKKLKELFIEKKIPSWRRDLFPVVRQGGKILYVPLVYKHRFGKSQIYTRLEVRKIDESKDWIFYI